MYMRSGKAELQNVKEDNAMWTEGTMDGYEYWVKHYEVGSSYGIDEGRISKLSIRKNSVEVYGYDRGLDHDELDAGGKAVYAKLLKMFN